MKIRITNIESGKTSVITRDFQSEKELSAFVEAELKLRKELTSQDHYAVF
jgi:hypothetical protein